MDRVSRDRTGAGRSACAEGPNARSDDHQRLSPAGNVYFYRKRYELALSQTDRALEINPSDVESYDMRGTVLVFAGRAAEALPWLEGALRFDRTDLLAAFHISVTYYFLARYAEAIAAGDRALARNPGRIVHTTIHPFLAAA